MACPCPSCNLSNLSQARRPVFLKKIEADKETAPGLRACIDGCQAEDVGVRSRIHEALHAAGRVVVWGVGAHTLRLLANGALDPSNIALFVDSNHKYQHRELCGIRVAAPAELRGRTEPILISSRGFQPELQQQIRHELELNNPLILLYEAHERRTEQP